MLLLVSVTQLQNHIEIHQLDLSYGMQIDLISNLQLVRLHEIFLKMPGIISELRVCSLSVLAITFLFAL